MTRVALCLIALLLAGGSAAAQTDPRLVAAVRSAQEGQGDSARSAVDRLLAATPPTDSLYPEILYTQAMVANTAADMRRHLQRVVVEHPTSPWVDDALLRLVQMDYATRSFDAAARNLERLRLDYPVTPLFAQAAYWGGRTYFSLQDTTQACRWLSDGIARAEADLELQRQLGFLYQRCGTAGQRGGGTVDTAGKTAADTAGRPGAVDSAAKTATADSAPRGATGDSAPRPAAADSAARRVADSLPRRPAAQPPRFRVQVAAVATPGAADDAASKAEALGFPAIIVRERGYYKVRAGEFATRQEAQAAVARLKARIGGSPFVVAEP
jgi:tetratricopeptide (TPR) repeat protein